MTGTYFDLNSVLNPTSYPFDYVFDILFAACLIYGSFYAGYLIMFH